MPFHRSVAVWAAETLNQARQSSNTAAKGHWWGRAVVMVMFCLSETHEAQRSCLSISLSPLVYGQFKHCVQVARCAVCSVSFESTVSGQLSKQQLSDTESGQKCRRNPKMNLREPSIVQLQTSPRFLGTCWRHVKKCSGVNKFLTAHLWKVGQSRFAALPFIPGNRADSLLRCTHPCGGGITH